jgi:hypothetical protein
MENNESDLSSCRLCEKIKVRKLVGKFDDKNKKYIDETGILWSGRICPACHKDRVKFRMRKLRATRKEDESLQPV